MGGWPQSLSPLALWCHASLRPRRRLRGPCNIALKCKSDGRGYGGARDGLIVGWAFAFVFWMLGVLGFSVSSSGSLALCGVSVFLVGLIELSVLVVVDQSDGNVREIIRFGLKHYWIVSLNMSR